MKYYITYYEAYPIYEPAEGGYYYEGINAVEWAYWDEENNFDEVFNHIGELAEKYDLKNLNVDKKWAYDMVNEYGNIMVAIDRSKYIGDNRYLYLENETAFKSEECGWHPYE